MSFINEVGNLYILNKTETEIKRTRNILKIEKKILIDERTKERKYYGKEDYSEKE